MLSSVAAKRWAVVCSPTTDTLVLDQSFFRPLGMQHFYDSFALVSQICVRRDALVLFGLNDDELLPDLHITRAGVLRAGIGYSGGLPRGRYRFDQTRTSESEQNDPPSSLASDAEQYERMQASYAAVGRDFKDQEDFIGSEYRKLQRLELVPQRWPLARLSFSLQKCVDHLDRVLAGCCWEVHATRADPEESLSSLRQVSKCLTMLLAIYLAKEVAAILREILTHPTKRLYDDSTAHLLCSNYWVQPIYQELLHSSSRYNATRTGEKNRPSNGLARISAHPRPPKKLKPAASGTRFTDWIGGICYVDILQVWFPAQWAPVVLHQLQHKEDEYRAAHPSWMDEEVVPDDIQKQWQEARANRRMQFKVGDYKDSNIRMLTGTIKADWIQLPVESYLAALPTLKQGVITGVFKIKGASPWAITRAEKLQVSVFLPNDLSLDEWYAGVYALPTVWPDVTMLGASNLRRVVGYDFHHLRKKYDVPSMWGNIHPQWRLLQQHLETKGPGWYPLAEREERLFTNRSNRPGDDMKDELRTDSDPIAWRIWSTSQNQLWQLRQPAPPLEFPGEQGMLTNMYAQVREEEQVISLQFICSQQDVSKSRRKKRKQVDDGTAIV